MSLQQHALYQAHLNTSGLAQRIVPTPYVFKYVWKSYTKFATSITSITHYARSVWLCRTSCVVYDIQIRTYAVGAFSLRQSGTVSFIGVRWCRALRGTTAHKEIPEYHAAAGKQPRIELPNNAPAQVLQIFNRIWYYTRASSPASSALNSAGRSI